MFRIGDFSKLAQVTVRTLRLYDELGLFRPAHIDKFTDYRYYSIEQLPRLNRILALKDLGFSLEQVARLLNENVSVGQLQGMLMMKRAEIEHEVKEAQARLARVAARLRQIEREGTLPQYEVVLKAVEPQTIVSSRRTVPDVRDMPEYRCQQFKDVYDWLAKEKVKPLEPELAIYYNPEYTEQNIDMELAVPVDSATGKALRPDSAHMAVRELPGVESMASVIHKGDIWDVGQAITALYTWIGANNLTSSGPYRELHLFWRELETDERGMCDIVLEMQIPVAPLDSGGA